MPQKSKRNSKNKGVVAVTQRRARGRGEYSIKPEVSTAAAPASRQPGAVNRLARAAGEALGNAIPLIPGIGRLIPTPVVSAAASALGDAGSWLARAFGFGTYHLRRNTLLNAHPPVRARYGNPNRGFSASGVNLETMPQVAAPPSFGSVQRGSDIVFAHREYIGDVRSSIGFQKKTYVINPGNPKMFPWMSQVGNLYEEYEMLGLIFEYRSTSATAVGTVNAGMGVVLMATDYDCYDDNFNSKREMEAAEFSSAAVPYETFLHPVECDPRRNVLRRNFVVPGITSYTDAQGDARLSVLGNFTIATEGQQTDGQTIGELWVTYHVRLSRPVLEPSPLVGNSYAFGYTATIVPEGGVHTSPSAGAKNGRPFTISTSGNYENTLVLINNTTARRRGTHLIVQTWQDASNPGATSIIPTTREISIAPSGSAIQKNVSFLNSSYSLSQAWVNSGAASGIPLYTITSLAAVDFKADNAVVSMPSLYANGGPGVFSLMILPYNDPFNLDPAVDQPLRMLPYHSTVPVTTPLRQTTENAAAAANIQPSPESDDVTPSGLPLHHSSEEEIEQAQTYVAISRSPYTRQLRNEAASLGLKSLELRVPVTSTLSAKK